jgi:hypothetical protein
MVLHLDQSQDTAAKTGNLAGQDARFRRQAQVSAIGVKNGGFQEDFGVPQ